MLYALGGIARGGFTRGGYHGPNVFISIAGSARRSDVRRGSLTVRDVLNERPNTALLTLDGGAPSKGDQVIVTLGTINRLTKLFAGHALVPTQIYEGKPSNVAWHLSCTDYTWLLNSRQVTKRYLSESASDIAIDLIETYAPIFSTAAITTGLDTIDEITFTNTNLADCLTQVARRIGGYWKVDYLGSTPRVLLWQTSALQAPTPLEAGGSPLIRPRFRNLQFTEDLSGVITRVYGEGGGANAIQQVAVGETIIPVETADWYNPAGGTVKSGPQIITYTGRSLGGGGTLVGPGASPSAAPALALASGAGVNDGNHDYAVSFVTAAGESLIGPSAAVTTGNLTPPSTAPSAGSPTSGGSVDAGNHDYEVTFVTSAGETTPSPASLQVTTGGAGGYVTPPTGAPSYGGEVAGSLDMGATYYYAYTFVNANGETTPSPTVGIQGTFSTGYRVENIAVSADGSVTARKLYRTVGNGSQLKLLTTINNNTATAFNDTIADSSLGANVPTSNTAATSTLNTVPLTAIPIGPASVTSRKLYRRFNGAGTFKLVTTIANNTATTYSDTTANASLGADAPVANTAAVNQVSLSAIPIGGATVTARKIYRTAAGGVLPFKLVTTIADNTTTTYLDSTADGSLGASAPVSDTSGLTQPNGQVSAGSTSLLVAGTGSFSSTGGWAVIGNGQQVIRYSGITGSSLTGIPALGAGSITASVAYNSNVTAAPVLTGVPASGAGAVQFSILRGDPVNIWVQRDNVAAQVALAALINEPGFDGVREDNIQDRRLSEDEIIARCDVLLEKRKDARAEIRYQTQDVTTQSGAQITVNLGDPTNISGTFTIQEVSIGSIQESPSQIPNALPWYSVVASTDHYTLEDLLRQRRAA